MLLLVQSIVLTTAAFSTSQLDIVLFSAIASFIACVGLCPLLVLEHSRSVKPSDLAVVYLLGTLACDSVQLGTTLYGNGISAVAGPAISNIFVKFVLLVIESQGKGTILRGPHGQWPPELLAGILDRTFFWWINSILAQGNQKILTEDNLPPLDPQLSSELLRHRALKAWDQRGSHGSNRMTRSAMVV